MIIQIIISTKFFDYSMIIYINDIMRTITYITCLQTFVYLLIHLR